MSLVTPFLDLASSDTKKMDSSLGQENPSDSVKAISTCSLLQWRGDDCCLSFGMGTAESLATLFHPLEYRFGCCQSRERQIPASMLRWHPSGTLPTFGRLGGFHEVGSIRAKEPFRFLGNGLHDKTCALGPRVISFQKPTLSMLYRMSVGSVYSWC